MIASAPVRDISTNPCLVCGFSYHCDADDMANCAVYLEWLKGQEAKR